MTFRRYVPGKSVSASFSGLHTAPSDFGTYFRPASGLNEETRRLYQGNLFSVVRQLHYSAKHPRASKLSLRRDRWEKSSSGLV